MVDSLYRQLIRILNQAGCVKFREGKGSHEIWLTPNGRHLVIPSIVRTINHKQRQFYKFCLFTDLQINQGLLAPKSHDFKMSIC
jgi:predicted RNA binding protein YcfA (HicA-like mRNA interferase family)